MSSDEEDTPSLVPLPAGRPAAWAHATSSLDAAQPAVQRPGGEADAGPPLAPVPVTLITGFLGAGKTTLVNYILTARHGCRCAVLLNELADSADIERALVQEPEGAEAAPIAEWRELENGCICCSAKNDMVKALESLLQQRDKFDCILIETTGLANPGPVAAALWTDPELESGLCLDAVLAVVDAKHVRRQLADSRPDGAVNEAQQQVAFADLVLLNKTDLVSEAELAAVEREVRAINGSAAIVRCQRCSVDLRQLLNTGLYSSAAAAAAAAQQQLQDAAGTTGATAAVPGATQHEVGGCAEGSPGSCGSWQPHTHSHHDHPPGPCPLGCSSSSSPAERQQQQQQQHWQEGGRVCTVTIELERPLSLPALRHWLDELLWERTAASDLFRVKGLLAVGGSDHKAVLQAVHEVYDVVEGPAWRPGERRRSKLVLIGRHLDAAQLEAQLSTCCLPGPDTCNV